MAITVSLAAPTVFVVNVTFQDYLGESTQTQVVLDGSATAAELGVFLTNWETMTNCIIKECSIVATYIPTGMRTTPVSSGEPFMLVSTRLLAGFLAPHPLQSAITLRKGVIVPGIASGALDGVNPNPQASGGGAAQALYDWLATLETIMAFRDISGTYHEGIYVYNSGRSAVMTTASVLDGE